MYIDSFSTYYYCLHRCSLFATFPVTVFFLYSDTGTYMSLNFQLIFTDIAKQLLLNVLGQSTTAFSH